MDEIGYYKDFIGRKECDACHMTFRHMYETQIGAFKYRFHSKEEWNQAREHYYNNKEQGRPDLPLTEENSSVTLDE